jgi:hypothetical protein
MMKSEVLLGILIFYSCHTVPVAEICGTLKDGNYTAIERLLLTESNLIKLEDAFFPTNSHPSVVVDVFYRFTQPENHNHTLKFRWMVSPVHLLVEPALLKMLSLMTYQENAADLTLELEVTCDTEFIEMSAELGCKNAPALLYQLNNLTSNVSRHLLASAPRIWAYS